MRTLPLLLSGYASQPADGLTRHVSAAGSATVQPVQNFQRLSGTLLTPVKLP